VELAKGSHEPPQDKVGKLSQAQIEEIATIKMPDLKCFDLEAAIRSVRGMRAVRASTWRSFSRVCPRS